MHETLKELAAELAVIHESLERAEAVERQLGVYWREFEADLESVTAERDQLKARLEAAERERDRLKRRDEKLTCLEAGGVDNWDGYDFAMEDYNQ